MKLLMADASGIYVAKIWAELEKKIKMEEGIFRIRNSLPGDTVQSGNKSGDRRRFTSYIRRLVGSGLH